jgi:antitoxin PrlF
LHAQPISSRNDANLGYAHKYIVQLKAVLQNICYSASMNATLTLTDRGVISLPAALRRAVGLKPNDQLIAEATPDGILLRPAVTLPVEHYSAARIAEFDEGEMDLADFFVAHDSVGVTASKRAPRISKAKRR